MFQDIGNHEFHNEYKHISPQDTDYILCGRGNKILLKTEGNNVFLPIYKEMYMPAEKFRYLLAVDGDRFFMCIDNVEEFGGYHYDVLGELRDRKPEWLVFAAVTATHLLQWYQGNKYCGRCGNPYNHSDKERALVCPMCGQTLYPSIAPVVIVAVTDGDRLLLTRYSTAHGNYKRHALNAGFMEIGETPEDTIRREILEEVGLKVTNIRYFKSQPWGFSHSLLLGFFADVEGSRKIRVDEDELSEALWFDRDDIPLDDSEFSLTWTMIRAFKKGDYPR